MIKPYLPDISLVVENHVLQRWGSFSIKLNDKWSFISQKGIPMKALFQTSLEVQWLRLCASIVGDTSSIPGQGTKIPQAAWQGQKKKRVCLILGTEWSLSEGLVPVRKSFFQWSLYCSQEACVKYSLFLLPLILAKLQSSALCPAQRAKWILLSSWARGLMEGNFNTKGLGRMQAERKQYCQH